MTGYRKFLMTLLSVGVLALCAAAPGVWGDDDDSDDDSCDDDAIPFGVTSVIIETTDNDIELQVFVDGFQWKNLEIEDPRGRRIFKLNAQRRLRTQGGLSEMGFASQPTEFPEDAPSDEAAETVEDFLDLWPEGEYDFEADTTDGGELVGEATLTHVLPALPEIVAPVPDDEDELPELDPEDAEIEWEAVTTRFIGSGPVEIVGYQVIVEQVEPFRKLVINLAGDVTSATIPPEFLENGQLYDFEIVAFEESGNATISVGEFTTSD